MAAARRLAFVLAAAIVAALGVAVLVQAQRHPDQAPGGAGAGALALQLAAGLGACAAGAELAMRRSMRLSGALLAASGTALLLGAVPLPEAGGAVPFTAALAGGAFAPALAGAAALCHPIAPRRLGPLALVATVAAIALLGVLPTAAFDPAASGCFSCPRNLLLIHGDLGLRDALVNAGLRAQALLCLLLAITAGARWARQPGLRRQAAAPVALGGALAAALGGVAFVQAVIAGTARVDASARALWLAQCAALALAAAGVAIQALQARALRARIANRVLATLPSPELLRDALARSLGDPELAITYPGTRNGPVDAEGRPARDPAPGTATTEVTRSSQVVALLHHDAAVAPERLAAAARGAGPAIEHASLRARLRAELAELRASRTRIVQVADDERRRAERDLHDGAQQRLIALSLALAPLASQYGALTRARDELRTALDDLRTLAHGIHAAALSEAGVAAALAELAEHSRVPVHLAGLTRERWPAPVEAAVYRLVLDGIGCTERTGDGHGVEVKLERAGPRVRATLVLPGVRRAAASLALQHAGDRIGALDGELELHDQADGTRVEAGLQCGS
jgi:signal transduction histidine kinase